MQACDKDNIIGMCSFDGRNLIKSCPPPSPVTRTHMNRDNDCPLQKNTFSFREKENPFQEKKFRSPSFVRSNILENA